MIPDIHKEIKSKLEYFHKVHKIPNIIFHGPSGSGKRTIVNDFIATIYDHNKETIKSFVMYVNCAHGKGIKFIREDLKFFAKTHINSNGGDTFKSIVLLNADKLTMDAQSALRRCIELFSHNTRFLIIVEDKYKLLKPILSRFCEIYIEEPMHNGAPINLYKHNLEETFKLREIKATHLDWLRKELLKRPFFKGGNASHSKLVAFSIKLVEKGYSGVDIINLLEDAANFRDIVTDEKRYELLVGFNKVRKELRNEKLIIFFILNFLYISSDQSLENISFM